MRSDAGTWTRYLVPLGRVAFAGVFVAFAPANFTQQGIAWGASQGIPLARVLVPLAGVISLLGGLSVILGYRVKIGRWQVVLLLVPVTGMLHSFWAVKDLRMAQFQCGCDAANESRS